MPWNNQGNNQGGNQGGGPWGAVAITVARGVVVLDDHLVVQIPGIR